MIVALAIALLAALAIVAALERTIRRERVEAAAVLARSRAETAAVRADAATERDRAADERRELYQRIQAPEIAVHDAQLEARRQRPYTRREPVGADNDAAFAARRGAGSVEKRDEVDDDG